MYRTTTCCKQRYSRSLHIAVSYKIYLYPHTRLLLHRRAGLPWKRCFTAALASTLLLLYSGRASCVFWQPHTMTSQSRASWPCIPTSHPRCVGSVQVYKLTSPPQHPTALYDAPGLALLSDPRGRVPAPDSSRVHIHINLPSVKAMLPSTISKFVDFCRIDQCFVSRLVAQV